MVKPFILLQQIDGHPRTSLMPTLRSARVRAASVSKNTANNPSDENNAAQSRKRRAGKAASVTEKQTAKKQDTQRKTSQPLQDVTNVRNTRSRRPRKTAPKLSKETDDEVTPTPGRTTRSHKQVLQPSASSHAIPPIDSPVDTVECNAECNAQVEKPSDDIDDEITPAPRQRRQPPRPPVASKETHPADSPNETTRLNAVVEGSSSDEIRPNSPQRNYQTAASGNQLIVDEIRPNTRPQRRRKLSELSQSSDEIQPNPPKRNHWTTAQASPSSSDEIRPNTSRQRRRELLMLTRPSDEIQPQPARAGRPSVTTTRQSHARPASPAISNSPPMLPAGTKEQTETHQTSWSDENRDPNKPAFDTRRPRQVVHTYGKRRRAARVSLPTMQALGVRAKSPSSGSQNDSEKEEDGEASEEYNESEDESEDSPKRDPKLHAFLAEQKRLWQEVDETDLLVESD